MLVIDALNEAVLGLAPAQFLYRAGGKKSARKNHAFEEKESFRWLNATRSASALAEGGAACVTVVAEREGDIYEEFALRPGPVELLIHVSQDRTSGRRHTSVYQHERSTRIGP
jgi:hypothetical protein